MSFYGGGEGGISNRVQWSHVPRFRNSILPPSSGGMNWLSGCLSEEGNMSAMLGSRRDFDQSELQEVGKMGGITWLRMAQLN